MKKFNLFFVVTFALLLGSCQKDNSLNSNPSDFNSSVNRESNLLNN